MDIYIFVVQDVYVKCQETAGRWAACDPLPFRWLCPSLTALLLLCRLLSCTVMLEMLAAVNSCTLGEILQQLVNRNAGMMTTRPLTRMGQSAASSSSGVRPSRCVDANQSFAGLSLVVCRPRGSSLHSLLTSNLTWVSDLPIWDVCEPGESPSPW